MKVVEGGGGNGAPFWKSLIGLPDDAQINRG